MVPLAGEGSKAGVFHTFIHSLIFDWSPNHTESAMWASDTHASGLANFDTPRRLCSIFIGIVFDSTKKTVVP